MKLVIRPIQEPRRELDVTRRLVSAIAEELWSLYGGNDQLNWVEAEHHLQRILEEVRAQAREAEGTELLSGQSGHSDNAEQVALDRATQHAQQPVRSHPSASPLRRLKSDRALSGRATGWLARPESRALLREHATRAHP